MFGLRAQLPYSRACRLLEFMMSTIVLDKEPTAALVRIVTSKRMQRGA